MLKSRIGMNLSQNCQNLIECTSTVFGLVFRSKLQRPDDTILIALSEISAEQSVATSKTQWKVTKLKLTNLQPRSVLCAYSYASYLSVSRARRRASGIFFSENSPNKTQHIDKCVPLMNGIVYVFLKILDKLMASAAEEEVGAAFIKWTRCCPNTHYIDINKLPTTTNSHTS